MMETTWAQIATLVLSAAGALSILVGVLDQPALATGYAAGPLVGATFSPAVSPMA